MSLYKAPLADMRFALFDVLKAESQYARLPGGENATRDILDAVLDEAAMTLSEAKRTSAMKAEIASHILACAAKGERDPVVLKMNALLTVVE